MKLQIFGFAIIVAAAVAGVDYSMQAKATNQSLGLTGYADTITGRFHATIEARARKSRQKADVKIHLPEAPEGWIRSEWAEADTTRLEPQPTDLSGFRKNELREMELAPMMGGMVVTKIQMGSRVQRKTIWVYTRGDDTIALRVIYTKTGATHGFPGLDANIDKANAEGIKTATPYAFVQGVGFGEVRIDPVLTGPVSYRNFSASMGGNIVIAVRADASDASIKALMGMIDYDGLNGMLDQALTGVGRDAPAVDPEQALALAEQALAQRRVALTGEPPVAVVADPVEVAEPAQTAAIPVEKTAPQKVAKFGFESVTSMPGQKCARQKGSNFCGGFTTE